MKKYKDQHDALQKAWNDGKVPRMGEFVQDLRAAVYSPQAVKAFKRKYEEDYRSLLINFIEESACKVRALEQIVADIENTAATRQ
jgi:hypothetical protein